MNKRNYFVGLILGFVILALTQMPGEKARMVVCDVGQGDGILIIKGNNQVLIDGGPSTEKILACLGEQMPFYDRRIELIVLTNTDFDHLNGLASVVERYEVIQFVTADGVHDSDALTKMGDKLREYEVEVQAVERGDMILVGEGESRERLSFNVLWPPETVEEYVAILSSQLAIDSRKQILSASAKRGDLNERSVVLLLLEDNKRVLLMGDAGDQTEKELVKLGNLPDVDYLKVGHHGSRYASSLGFLQAIRPEWAVISVGEKNRYGHPTEETLERLKSVGAEIHRTDLEGEVVITL